ncbi:MAG TPA: HIT domain-containing protein [Thermoanaerobaculia bacterium]|nr:HIT domain-containing protein [Thermoanaerobaculia bacterium]
MEILFTPWRLAYLTGETGGAGEGCLFCRLHRFGDAEGLVVHRGAAVYAVLNRYPYSTGHLMVTPYAHHGSLGSMTVEVRSELMEVAARAERILGDEYACHGLNVGFNLGRSAGAGIPGHAHLHVVPRWDGDTNFMTVVGGTRTLPEDLAVTRERLARGFVRAASARPEGPA